MGVLEVLLYCGPTPPPGRPRQLHDHILREAKGGALTQDQVALAAGIGLKSRNSVGPLVAQLTELGCVTREPGFGADGTRTADRLLIPMWPPESPQAARLSAEIGRGLANYVRGNAQDLGVDAPRLGPNFGPILPNGTEDGIQSARESELAPEFPAADQRAWAEQLFAEGGLLVGLDEVVEDFRARNEGVRRRDWVAWWQGYCTRRVEIERRRASRAAKTAARKARAA